MSQYKYRCQLEDGTIGTGDVTLGDDDRPEDFLGHSCEVNGQSAILIRVLEELRPNRIKTTEPWNGSSFGHHEADKKGES
jgi:hypothetical protein